MLSPAHGFALLSFSLAIATAASAVRAQIVLVGAGRTLNIGGQVVVYDENYEVIDTISDGDGATANAFDPFDESVGLTVGGGGGGANGRSAQNSHLEAESIGAELIADVFASGTQYSDVSAGATSSFALTFDVPAPQEWLITASTYVVETGYASLQLTRGTETIVELYESAPALHETLLLDAGRYDLTASAEASAQGGNGFGFAGQADVTLALSFVPEPGAALLAALAIATLAMLARDEQSRRA